MTVEQFNGAQDGRPGLLFRFRCTGCAYGASRHAAPERCPMCGGSTWEFEDWRPFSTLMSDLVRTRDNDTRSE
jgi:rubrerythrin